MIDVIPNFLLREVKNCGKIKKEARDWTFEWFRNVRKLNLPLHKRYRAARRNLPVHPIIVICCCDRFIHRIKISGQPVGRLHRTNNLSLALLDIFENCTRVLPIPTFFLLTGTGRIGSVSVEVNASLLLTPWPRPRRASTRTSTWRLSQSISFSIFTSVCFFFQFYLLINPFKVWFFWWQNCEQLRWVVSAGDLRAFDRSTC